MTFQVALLIFGILLLLLGLVGKIKARDLEVGATNTFVRGVAIVLGSGFIASAFYSQLSADGSSAGNDPVAAQSVTLKPLYLFYNTKRIDNFTTATMLGIKSAVGASYYPVRVEGCILRKTDPSRDTVPLQLYWSDRTENNFTVANPESEKEAKAKGFNYIRDEGFVYSAHYPDTVPLKLYQGNGGRDYYTVATKQAESIGQAGGYVYIRDEAYIYPQERCQ